MRSGRDTGELPPQSVALLGGAEPRQLQEPGRRDRTQQRHQRAVDAAQLRQGFKDREVRLAAAVLIDALAADAKNIAETGNEMLDQRRLADTRLAGNPHDPAFARAREIPIGAKSRKGFRAPDERARLGGAASWNDCRDRWRSDYRAGGRDEAVASPRYRFNEARLAGVVVERRPQLADRGSQHRVRDVLVAPYLIEQRVGGKQGPGLPHERAQHAEGRRRDSDRAFRRAAGVRSPRPARTDRSAPVPGSSYPTMRRGRYVEPFRYERCPRPSRDDNGVKSPCVGVGP